MRRALATLALLDLSCGKVPIYNVYAGFSLADAAWFEEEETLFFFYRVTAEQGLGDPSVVEITYATDDERVPWTPISAFPTVHTHDAVDCGRTSLCGSTSIAVEGEPREVGIRLRYHKDGELALDAHTIFNVVARGAPHSNRSYVPYGVFDEHNQRVQWRGRHLFPTLRNQDAEDLGLRRALAISDRRYGTAELTSHSNPYGYGVDCPSTFTEAELDTVETNQRAVFDEEDLPIGASDASVVCAEATVTDATGPFTATALAQKNPEVRPAFPVLRSPVRDATRLEFFLGPCDYTISHEHEEMQRQRLELGDLGTYCTDDWESETFVGELAAAFTDAVEAARPDGVDMVLVIALHQDDSDVAERVEEALALVVPEERHRSSPRLAGAFVFDSDIRGLTDDALESSTLWCPATLPTGTEWPGASSLTCAIAPDNPNVELGPFTFGTLPILPSRSQYLDFIETYSVRQAGEVHSLELRTPEFATTSDHLDIGDYGVVTFLNDELITADSDDAFSFCVGDEYLPFVFRTEYMQSEAFFRLIADDCASGALAADFCDLATLGMLPISYLGQWHSVFRETNYDLGIFWDFPFLLRMEYEIFAAGTVGAFGFSVPFGVGAPGESYLGTSMWTSEEFSLEEELTQCRRFCDHPTFDSAGVYHITDPFRSTYAETCYLPDYPKPGDSGSPLDP